MPTPSTDDTFNQAINAIKSGDKSLGKQLLMNLIAQDEENEMAWLWLSTAVSKNEEKIICLENVLTLNPTNTQAKKILEKLKAASTTHKEQIIRRKVAPLSGAEAILYPERLSQEWRWTDPTTIEQGVEVGYQAHETSDDAWTKDADLCPYCAKLLEDDEKRCGECKRPLLTKQYRYPKMSSSAHLFWVMLLGIANINLIQALYDFIFWQDILGVLTNGLYMLLFFTTALGAMMRKLWAFIGAQILLVTLLLYAFINVFSPIRRINPNLPEMDPAIAGFIEGLGSGFGGFLIQFEVVAVIITLVLAFLFLAPDFEKVSQRTVAAAKEGLQHGADYHLVAKRAAERGMWATAVKNWQRAAAKEPNRLLFLQSLAHAYAKVHHFQRSADVLQSALRLTQIESKKQEIEKQLTAVRAKQQQMTYQMEHSKK